ncbi:MAG: aminotransferase class I/II-fold pyridoxal phosphate-dependent enzyme [Bacteroidetes bacterium]|nr:MAG: aminotransferase class I/II-fold pyridoxal phosphate-dependent enzyme [Bacteroidota bacterium]
MTSKKGFSSTSVHGVGERDKMGSVVTPIYQTSTFFFESAEDGARCFAGESDGYIYTRLGNPTIDEFEATVAALEHGFNGIATSSGMAAVNTVYLTYLGQGDHVVCHNALYGPSRGILETAYPRFGVESTFVDTTDLKNVEQAIRPTTRLIFLETPANPTIGICDLNAISELAHRYGIKVCVDNTFCSPYLQNPLDLGADIVLHSLTKFINGHADIVGGIVVPKSQEDYKKLNYTMTNFGFNMDPHQAFLARRGLKTLGIRIDRAQQNAMKVAEYLESHAKVAWVKYPGLPSHPQFELGKRQMRGPGAMISFELKEGYEAGRKLMNHVKFCVLAVSLGGIETLIQHPASMTHSKLSKEAKEVGGITQGLVRLSIGIEEAEDIIGDLEQALEKA